MSDDATIADYATALAFLESLEARRKRDADRGYDRIPFAKDVLTILEAAKEFADFSDGYKVRFAYPLLHVAERLGKVSDILSMHEHQPSIYEGDDRSVGSAEGAYDLATEIREALK